jgi:hypothetical protein
MKTQLLLKENWMRSHLDQRGGKKNHIEGGSNHAIETAPFFIYWDKENINHG